MGFMTEMSILNDDWHRFEEMIREEPEKLIGELRELMNGRYMREDRANLSSDTVHGVYLKVYRSHHADDPRVYLSYQNRFIALDPHLMGQEWLADQTNPDFIQRQIDDVEMAQRQLKYTKDVLKEQLKQAKLAVPKDEI